MTEAALEAAAGVTTVTKTQMYGGLMVYFTILRNGEIIGGEFGRSAEHALNRYAEGSIFPSSELTAERGVKREIVMEGSNGYNSGGSAFYDTCTFWYL